jgi:hypothetical protein
MLAPLRRPWKIAIAIASFLLLLGTANAAAAMRFAAPGGTAPASSECKREAPCSLFSAASDSASSSALQAGDEVVVLPGTYSVPAGDLGPFSTLSFLRGIQVHGLAGQPRPLIVVAGGTNRLLQISPEDVVSDLEVESGSRVAVFIVGGVVDEVIVRDSAGQSVACRQNGGVLRDSACLDSGFRGRALEGNSVADGPLELRNVTAIATGQASLGLHFGAVGGGQLTVDAKAVIAEGGEKDIEAGAEGPGSNVTVDLENSDFDSREARVGNGGTASITAPGSGANIIEPPQLAVDGYHELPGSPTVDRGVVDAPSGTTDIDGEARTIGIAPDIGADELGRDPIDVSLSCVPSAVEISEASTCTITVKDAINALSQPEGEVRFESDHNGDFTPASASCELEGISADEAGCHVTYTPTEGGEHLITAEYRGDDSHNSGSAPTQVTVAAHPSATTLLCAPATVVAAEASTCTVSVKDPFQANPIQPNGEVHFESDHNGDFTPASAKCKLEGVAADEASCHLTYTPAENGTHEMTVSFPGDQSHDSSHGSAQVTVAPHPSATTVACTPASLMLGSGAATCTATVADLAARPKTPGGSVEFTGDGRGAFSSGGRCALANTQGGKASCQILYTPSAAGALAHAITASYGGDTAHEKSQGQARLDVIEAPKIPKVPIADPNTKLTKKPRKKTVRRRARFAFVSDQAGSTFLCKLDRKPFRPCRSPFKRAVKPGRHTFKVRAIDPQGLSDLTPAVYKWRVGRARH